MKLAMFMVFRKTCEDFIELSNFFQKKLFWTYLELLSINKFRDAFYEKFAKFRYFWKNQGMPFQKVQKIIILEIFQTSIPFETLSPKVLVGIAIMKSITYFLENIHGSFQKAPTFELFQFSEAIRPFETHSGKFSPEWAISKKIWAFFSETPIYISKFSNFWNFSDLLSNKTTWTASWKKHAIFTNFEENERLFQKKPSIFPKT